MSGKGRVTQLEEALKTVVGGLPAMASTASVSKVEGEVAAMAAASSMLKSYPFPFGNMISHRRNVDKPMPRSSTISR